MTIVRVGIQAVSSSAGQVVDFDASSVTIATVTNRASVPVQYSVNSGGIWATIAAGVTAALGVTVSAAVFRLRLAVDGAYPAPVDVDFAINEATASVSTTVTSLGAEEFRGGKLRGLATDNLAVDGQRSFQYVQLLARFRPNISRRFIVPVSASLGADYVIEEGLFTALQLDLASFAGIGCRTIICMSPSRSGLGDERREPTFWGSEAAKAKYAQAWGAVASRLAGDRRIAAFDIINEPYNPADGFATTQAGTDQILALQEACIAAIRAADPTRTCIVTCGWEGAPGGFNNMRPVAASNVVYTFHFYQPLGITHARVGGTPNYTGTFPSTQVVPGEFGSGVNLFGSTLATKSRMYADMQAPIAFAKRYGVPMFIGEFGCSRLVPGGVAPNWTEDAIAVFDELGWSWCHFGFWFPPLPWASLALDNSTQLIDFNNGTTSGQVSITSATGSTSARAPITPVSAALEDVALYEGAAQLPVAGVYVEETFEGTLGRLGGAGGAGAQDPGMSLNPAATAAPKTGTKHLRCTHTSTEGGSSQRAGYFLQDVGAGKDFGEFWLSFDVRLGAAITGSFVMVDISTFGDGTGANLRLLNNPGTNTWALDNWRGTGDYGLRPVFQLTGLTLPVGAYTNIKLAWQNSTDDGRMRVWQDGRLLVDINGFATTAVGTDRLWSVFYGLLFSTQVGQTLDFDNVKYSAGADLV